MNIIHSKKKKKKAALQYIFMRDATSTTILQHFYNKS